MLMDICKWSPWEGANIENSKVLRTEHWAFAMRKDEKEFSDETKE